MRVVSDTSPLSNLAVIDRLDLLKRRYGAVRIPRAVALELSALSHPAANARIDAALVDGWLVVETAPSPLPPLPFPLDAGETEAIALALAARADVLLMDEKRGREAARRNGLAVAGVLRELLHSPQRTASQPAQRDPPPAPRGWVLRGRRDRELHPVSGGRVKRSDGPRSTACKGSAGCAPTASGNYPMSVTPLPLPPGSAIQGVREPWGGTRCMHH